MGPIYNIVLNSTNGSGTTNQMNYSIDWGMLPNGKYKCKFSYNGKLQNQSTLNIARVYLDVGQSKQYEVVASFQSSSVVLNRCIGCLDSEIGLVPNTGIGAGSITGSVLSITSLTYGSFTVGQYISSSVAGITNGTYILSYGANTYGGVGTYNLSQSSTLAAASPVYGTNPPYTYLYCDADTNPPFYLDSKPSNNIISCSILNEVGVLWVDSLNNPPASYILTLSMELLD